MPSLLIVGADHLGNISDKLSSLGFHVVDHITGRKSQETKRAIPDNVDCILVLTDYVNHNLSRTMKQRAKEQALPICFAKRSWTSIAQALQTYREA